MGRLTLNVLLSFDQFEREVTGISRRYQIVLLNFFLPPPLPTFTADRLSDSLFVFSIEEVVEQVTLLGIGNFDA